MMKHRTIPLLMNRLWLLQEMTLPKRKQSVPTEENVALTKQMTTNCAPIAASVGIWKTNVRKSRKGCLRVASLVKP